MTAASSRRRHIDLSARERDHGRITEAAFDRARQYQADMEAPARTGGSAWNERVDGTRSGDGAAVGMVDAARQAERAEEWVERVVGPVDAGILRALLVEGQTFEQVAEAEGKSGDRGANYIARRFRDALEELAKPRKAVGARLAKISDKYSAMSEGISAPST